MDNIILQLEEFLKTEDCGKNWDGVYQDALQTIRRFFEEEGFSTKFLAETETESRHPELVAIRNSLTLHIPWEEDYNGRSLVDLSRVRVANL